MSVAAENLDRHIYEALSGDSELTALIPGGIHGEIAVAGTAFPHLLMVSYLPGSDRNLMGDPSKRAWTRFGVLLKSVSQGESFAENFAIMSRVETLLGGSRGRTVLGMYKDSEVRYIEQDGDVRYNHYGYVYRAIARDSVSVG